MYNPEIRKYIDRYGPFEVNRRDGDFLIIVSDNDSTDSIKFLQTETYKNIDVMSERTGFIVTPGDHPYEGFYEIPSWIRDELDVIELNEAYTFDLRRLLSSSKAMIDHYNYLQNSAINCNRPRIDFRVYGLKAPEMGQTQRGAIIVCPIEGTGITNDGHLIKGYMLSTLEHSVKFDSIQAWRMRELTRDELIEFDPRWGELVK